jgi:hypothetical protein
MSTTVVRADPPDPTSLESAQANVKAAAIAQCADLNAGLKARYLQLTDNIAISVYAYKDTTTTAFPDPPASYIPFEFSPGWFAAEPKGPPVCEKPPFPVTVVTPSNPPGFIHVLKLAYPNTDWYNAALDDTFPIGKQTPPIELPGLPGELHICLRVGTAVGPGWYEKVS